MKIALATTTINVPEVLREYRRLDSDVEFIVAGDLKSPHGEIERLCEELDPCTYWRPDPQEIVYPRLSEAIGWNNIQRRNIAILEAAKLKPDVIVSIDDDNWPMGDFFNEIRRAFARPHRGYLAKSPWFNIGECARDRFTYRGYPFRYIEPMAEFSPNGHPHRVGILNGLIYGDPDTNAIERIEDNPQVRSYKLAARAGIAVHPGTTWTPINAQNTAYRAELAPLMLQLPQVGRYDDIWGSYIAQAVLRQDSYHVLFGAPAVHQDRNEHDLEKDLADEQMGMAYSLVLANYLRGLHPEGTILERLRSVLRSLQHLELDLPHEFFDAWLEAWREIELEDDPRLGLTISNTPPWDVPDDAA